MKFRYYKHPHIFICPQMIIAFELQLHSDKHKNEFEQRQNRLCQAITHNNNTTSASLAKRICVFCCERLACRKDL